MAHHKRSINAIRRSRRRQGLRSQQQHAFISIVVPLLLSSLVISQHQVSGETPTYSPTYYPTYVPTISSNPSTHYPTYGPTASNITDSGSLDGGDRTTTDEENGALPNNEESKEVESNNQPSDDPDDSDGDISFATDFKYDRPPPAADNAANAVREVTMALAAAAAIVASVLIV
jgi:hypothetical protein